MSRGETVPSETPPATSEPTAPATSEPTASATTEPTTASTEPSYEGNFTQADVDFFKELFGGGESGINYYNRLLASDFTAPEDADIRKIFCDQDSDEDHPLTDAEKEFLGKQEVIALQLDVVRISEEKMSAVLSELLGLTLSEMSGKGLDRMVYFKDTGCYYHSHSDFGAVGFKILGGNWLEDGLVEVNYRIADLYNATMTLQKTETGYHVVSNVYNGFAS